MTKTVEEVRRAAFEVWMCKQMKVDKYTPQDAIDSLFKVDGLHGQYKNGSVQIGWAAFNAALDAVEIELPEPHSTNGGDCVIDYDETLVAIEQAGLGLKIK